MDARKIIILGALSAIAEATGRLYAKDGAELVLVGRNADRLARLAEDLTARGAHRCETRVMDLAEVDDPAATIDEMIASTGGAVDIVFVFYGLLGNQKEEERDLRAARRAIRTNFSSAAEWCLAAANRLEEQKRGVLVAVSSVAGDRGRQSNYIYGAAKAGLSTLMEGIAHRLAPSGAHAVLVKLGFVDTPMTAHIEKKGLLWAKPDTVARRLMTIADRPAAPVVYVPGFWRWIMAIIRNIPAPIFHKTKL
jgi:short-subunit dehydrogenase